MRSLVLIDLASIRMVDIGSFPINTGTGIGNNLDIDTGCERAYACSTFFAVFKKSRNQMPVPTPAFRPPVIWHLT